MRGVQIVRPRRQGHRAGQVLDVRAARPEKEEGFTLLCRAHAYEDLTIELLNYDEEMIRSGHPIQQA